MYVKWARPTKERERDREKERDVCWDNQWGVKGLPFSLLFLISQFGKVSSGTPLMSACYGRVSEPDQLGVQCTLVCAAIIHVNEYTQVSRLRLVIE